MVRRLGDLLVAEGLVKEEQLRQALAEQKGKTDKLGSILVRLDFISEEQLIGFLSRQYGIPSITLTNLDIDGETLRLVPAHIAKKYEVLPVKRIGGTLTLAMSDPDQRLRARRRRLHDQSPDPAGGGAAGGHPEGDRARPTTTPARPRR